jgi:hypothetical protein
MSLLDQYMQSPRLRQVDRIAVRASPEQAWQAVRHVDAYKIGFVRGLFALRQVPDALLAKLRGREPVRLTPTATIDEIAGPSNDFRLLCEVPGRGFAVGGVGNFWSPRIRFVHPTPEGFAAFAEPGNGKVVWGLEVASREGGGAWVSFEVRVSATDEESWRIFERYWLFIGQFSHAIRRAVMHMLKDELGRAPPVEERILAGDALLGEPRYVRTNSVLIEAPPGRVWPWLVQMGCGRGGWYALDLLDNGGKPSARHVHPEWQNLAPGDLLLATPDGSAAFGVLELEFERALVVGSPSLRSGGPKAPGHEPPFKMTWAFALEPIGSDATLLYSRVRADFEPSAAFWARYGWELLAHEVMQRAQLGSIKRLAENTPASD